MADQDESMRDQRGFSSSVARLLHDARTVRPSRLGDLIRLCAAELGMQVPTLWLVDLQQRLLVPFGHSGKPDEEALAIDITLAGRAYRTGQIQRSVGERDDEQQSQALSTWVPLLLRANCVGVLGGMVAEWDAVRADSFLLLGTAAANLLTTHEPSTDLILSTRRLQPASIEAEVQWSLLPPLSFTAQRTTICGVLEPAYDIGGDSLDYAVNDRLAHLAVFDAMGHGLTATLMVAIAVAAYRHSRRVGRTLEATYEAIDCAVEAEFGPEGFVTGVLSELDLDTGDFRYLLAGHHPRF